MKSELSKLTAVAAAAVTTEGNNHGNIYMLQSKFHTITNSKTLNAPLRRL